jgi:dTMP kinase
LVAETIAPLLDQGQVVIADRYYDSSTAYQGYGRGIDIGFIARVNSAVTLGLQPDLTILLYVDKFAATSKKGHNRFAPSLFDDRLEQEFMDFRKKVQQGFLEIARQNKERFLVIEASGKKEEISRKISARVDKLLRAKLKD